MPTNTFGALFGGQLVSALCWAVLAAVLCAAVRAVRRRRRGQRADIRRELLVTLLAFYLAAMLSQLILPVWTVELEPSGRWTWLMLRVRFGLGSPSLIPFHTIAQQLRAAQAGSVASITNLLANAVLFVPLGFLLPLLSPRFRSLPAMLFVGIGGPIAVETIQLFIGRSTDIDDVILNAAGCLAGYLLWYLALGRRTKPNTPPTADESGPDQ